MFEDQINDVVFAKWTSWWDRARLKTNAPTWAGVYLLGHFPNRPDSGPTTTEPPEEIVYIGETKNLDVRPLLTHNRLERYSEVCGDEDLSNLYVSVFRAFPTAHPDALALRAYTQFLEAKLDWEYTRCWGKRPALHFKERRL